jgi:hypothetical protein
MPRKPENTFISGVHDSLPPVNELYREKMHNPYRGGTADWWYSGAALDLWSEYKFVEALPVQDSTLVIPDLSPLQKLWLSGRHKEGRHVIVVLGTKTGAVVFKTPQEWEGGLPKSACEARRVSRAGLADLIVNHCLQGDRICTSRRLSP